MEPRPAVVDMRVETRVGVLTYPMSPRPAVVEKREIVETYPNVPSPIVVEASCVVVNSAAPLTSKEPLESVSNPKLLEPASRNTSVLTCKLLVYVSNENTSNAFIVDVKIT